MSDKPMTVATHPYVEVNRTLTSFNNMLQERNDQLVGALLSIGHNYHHADHRAGCEICRGLYQPAPTVEQPRTRVGVATFVFNKRGQFLLGKRKGSHGAGTWSLTGGHIEYGETVAQAAFRETLEETNITIDKLRIRSEGWSESLFSKEGKHYITIICSALAVDPDALEIKEPDKCAEWRWVAASMLASYTLFDPLAAFVRRNGIPQPPIDVPLPASWTDE